LSSQGNIGATKSQISPLLSSPPDHAARAIAPDPNSNTLRSPRRRTDVVVSNGALARKPRKTPKQDQLRRAQLPIRVRKESAPDLALHSAIEVSRMHVDNLADAQANVKVSGR